MEHREILVQYCTLLGDHTFLWQRKSAEDHGERRVGLAIRNTLLKMVKPGEKGYECLMTLHLHTSDGPITLVSIHAPTLTSTAEAKDKFYANLSEVVKNTSSLVTTMPEWVPSMTHGLPGLDTSELARSTRVNRACWSSATTTAPA